MYRRSSAGGSLSANYRELVTVLVEQLQSVLGPGMTVPNEFAELFRWIEHHGSQLEDRNGLRWGHLDRSTEEGSGAVIGTQIAFAALGNGDLHYWLGHDRKEVVERLCVFAQTGRDGSMAAFWLDENGQQRIVHLGSGSGSILCCVLADEPVDFLRLLAIGYEEICWSEDFGFPPPAKVPGTERMLHPSKDFRAWVAETFSVEIPLMASEIVHEPAGMDDPNTNDEFLLWLRASDSK